MDACAGDVVSGICMALDFLLSCASGRLSESAPAPRTPGLSHSWRCLQPFGPARAPACVRAFFAHAAHQPVARRLNGGQDALADAREGEAAGVIEPAAHRAGMAINLFGEGFEVEKVFEQVRHYCAPSVTVHDNLRTASAMSAKNNPVNSELLGRAFVVVLVLFEVGQRNVGRSVTK